MSMKNLSIGPLSVRYERNRQHGYRALRAYVRPFCFTWTSGCRGLHVLRKRVWVPILARPYKQYPA